jgi:flagellar FliL protein
VAEEELATDTATAVPAEAEAPKSKLKWIIIAAVVIALVGGGAAFVLLRKSPPPAKELLASKEPKVKSVLHLETFVINLADAEQKAYLRIGIDLGLAQAGKGKEGEGAAASVSLARDVIVGVLSVRQADELLTAEGKEKLKADLLAALRQRAPEMGVEEIYFTEFLIQR